MCNHSKMHTCAFMLEFFFRYTASFHRKPPTSHLEYRKKNTDSIGDAKTYQWESRRSRSMKIINVMIAFNEFENVLWKILISGGGCLSSFDFLDNSIQLI